MKEHLPNIYEYNNFRKFVADYQKALERQDRSYSKSRICKRLGIPNTRSYINDVINGRKVTPDYVERFIQVFKLEKEDAQFFRVLVKYNQAVNNDEKELYLEQLIALNRTPKKIIDKKAFFFSEWHHSVIRALLDVIDFKGDCRMITRLLHPQVSLLKVKESISLLKSLGLVVEDENGFWRPSNRSIATSEYLRDDLILNYQVQCLDLAKQALLKKPEDISQNISTNVISVSKEGYELINRKIERFRSEIRSLVHKDGKPSECVCQLNIQLFPSALITRRENDE